MESKYLFFVPEALHSIRTEARCIQPVIYHGIKN